MLGVTATEHATGRQPEPAEHAVKEGAPMCSRLTASAAHSGTFVDVIGGKVRCGERAAPEGSRACTNAEQIIVSAQAAA